MGPPRGLNETPRRAPRKEESKTKTKNPRGTYLDHLDGPIGVLNRATKGLCFGSSKGPMATSRGAIGGSVAKIHFFYDSRI
jgi:hypothetical protein